MNRRSSRTDKLENDDVRHIASLCRIGLTNDEVDKMREELISLLIEVRRVQAVDTLGVEPTGHAVEVDSIMRDDEPQEGLSTVQVLSNAPRRSGDYIRVHAVLEE